MKKYKVTYRKANGEIGTITILSYDMARAYDKVKNLNVISIEHEHKIKQS